jgi:hypothetical protein
MNRARFDRNRFARSVAMFQEAEWNELRWPDEASTGLLEEDEQEAENLEDGDEEKAGEGLNDPPDVGGLRADGRRRSDEDDSFEEEFDDEEDEFGEEEDEADEEFDDDFEEEEDLDEELEEEGEEEEL